MDKLEAEKRTLQIKLDQPVSDPASPRDMSNGDIAKNLSSHIQTLRWSIIGNGVTRFYDCVTDQKWLLLDSN